MLEGDSFLEVLLGEVVDEGREVDVVDQRLQDVPGQHL